LTFSEYSASHWHNGSSYYYRTPYAVANVSEQSTSFLLMQWSIADNNFYIYRNGVKIMNTTSYTWTKPSDSEFRIGSRQYFSANNLFQGSIAEVAVFNYQLETDNRLLVEGYLAWKWGINANLPSSHPYFYNPPYI